MKYLKKTTQHILVLLVVLTPIKAISQTIAFSSDFEDGDLTPEYESGSAPSNRGYVCDEEDGTVTVVSNPHPDAVNSSAYVAMSRTTENYYGDNSSHSRAEYRNYDRQSTEGHEHIFQWDVYFPSGWLDDITIYGNWFLITQFWSEPCSKYSLSTDSYYERFNTNIAYGGGIFNDIVINTDESETVFIFQFRAVPDENKVKWAFKEGVWQTITLQIYWTTEDVGYYNLYIDGRLLESQSNVQTLPTGWREEECSLRWKVGQYSSWKSDSKEYLTTYVDNTEWYIDGDISTIMDDSETTDTEGDDDVKGVVDTQNILLRFMPAILTEKNSKKN